MSPNRVVAFFTPVLAAAGAVGSGLAQKYLGVSLPPEAVTAVEVTVATSITAMGFKWLHGWQAFEAAQTYLKVNAPKVEQTAETVIHTVDPTVDAKKTAEDIKTAATNEAKVLLEDAEKKAAVVVQQAAAKLQALAPQTQPVETVTPASTTASHSEQQV